MNACEAETEKTMHKLYVLRTSGMCDRLIRDLKTNLYLFHTFTVIDGQLATKQRMQDSVTMVPTIITFDNQKYVGEEAVQYIKNQLQVFSQHPVFKYSQLIHKSLVHRIQQLEQKVAALEENSDRKLTQRGTQPRAVSTDAPAEMESTEDSALLKPTVIITKPKESLDATTLMQQRRNYHPHAR